MTERVTWVLERPTITFHNTFICRPECISRCDVADHVRFAKSWIKEGGSENIICYLVCYCVPLRRIGIDIVGPLIRSKNLYLHTISDFITRYPEAIQLAKIKTNTVVDGII